MKVYILLILPFLFSFKLNELYLDVNRSVLTNRHPMIEYNETKKGELNLGLKFNKGKFYHSVLVESWYTNMQFRYVALDYEAGVDFGKLKVYTRHKSEHSLDYENSFDYPNQNEIGVKLYLYKDE